MLEYLWLFLFKWTELIFKCETRWPEVAKYLKQNCNSIGGSRWFVGFVVVVFAELLGEGGMWSPSTLRLTWEFKCQAFTTNESLTFNSCRLFGLLHSTLLSSHLLLLCSIGKTLMCAFCVFESNRVQFQCKPPGAQLTGDSLSRSSPPTSKLILLYTTLAGDGGGYQTTTISMAKLESWLLLLLRRGRRLQISSSRTRSKSNDNTTNDTELEPADSTFALYLYLFQPIDRRTIQNPSFHKHTCRSACLHQSLACQVVKVRRLPWLRANCTFICWPATFAPGESALANEKLKK